MLYFDATYIAIVVDAFFFFADANNYYFLLFFCTLSWSTYFLSFRNSRVHLLR